MTVLCYCMATVAQFCRISKGKLQLLSKCRINNTLCVLYVPEISDTNSTLSRNNKNKQQL